MKFADEGRIRAFVARRGEESYILVVDMADNKQIATAIRTAVHWAANDDLTYTLGDALECCIAIQAETRKLQEDTDGK